MRPQFDILRRLTEAGWISCVDRDLLPPGFVLGQPLVYHMSLARPQSYFQALLRHKEIFEKRVGEILHFKTDGYYRCLLSLKAERLQSMLLSLEGASDAFFTKYLKDSGVVISVLDDEGEPVVDPEYESDAYPSMVLVPMCPHVVQPVGWQ